MKRRTFLKQAAAVAAGIAAGVKLPIADSDFPGLIGVDIARPGSEDFSAVAWYDKTGEVYRLQSFVIDRPPFDFYHLGREWNLTPAEVESLPLEDKTRMTAFDHIQAVMEEIEKRQTPWGRMMADIREDELIFEKVDTPS